MAARNDEGARTEAQRLALFAQLRRQLDGKRALMAEEDMFAAAPLLEATDTEALMALWPSRQGMAMVRPGVATVRSLTAD